MKKFVVFGSCLSAQVGQRLKAGGFTYLAALRHVRSDVFVEYINSGKGFSLKKNDIQYLLGNLKKTVEEDGRQRLNSQLLQNSTDSISRFLESLKITDFVIFDNQYDLEKNKHIVDVNKIDHLISNVNLNLFKVGSKNLGVINLQEFQYNKLSDALKKINPNLKLLFLQYPILKGEDLEKTKRNERVQRALITTSQRSSWTFFSTPLYEVDVKHAGEKNINHFKNYVYDELSLRVGEIIANEKVNKSEDVVFLDIVPPLAVGNKAQSPYANLPTCQYWKPAVAEPYPLAISDLYRKKFPIAAQDTVATCGSCFAQHIGKRLRGRGYRYLDLEPAPAELKAEQAKALGYGLYSARYGNVYTSRQLLQLFQRAFDRLHFDENWQDKAGRFVDPFRPNLCGEGYATAEAMLDAQREHLQQVRRMFETLDVFVFTMGLTETWFNRETGAVYPICPGVTAGTFDPQRYAFVNLDYATILDEMDSFLTQLRAVNPTARVLLTVSPVPLTATAEDRHVLLSTLASKSILRAVADQLYRTHENVDYFPSYDIILSPPYRGMFFKSNLRSIHEEGVDHVMSHFFEQHRLDAAADPVAECLSTPIISACKANEDTDEDDEAFCDEAFLELERNQAAP